jgi:hypothetical protein
MGRWTAKGPARAAVLGLALAAYAAGGAQAAQDSIYGNQQPAQNGKSGSGRSCFYARNISSWRAADRSTVYLRVNVNDYYRLTLLGDCPHIDWAEHIGVEHRGSPWICTGLDAMLIVPQGAGLHPLRCAVSNLRKLTPAEVKALPRKDKP